MLLLYEQSKRVVIFKEWIWKAATAENMDLSLKLRKMSQ